MFSASETYSNAASPLPHCDEARKHLAFCWPAQRSGRKPQRYSYSHAQWINKVLLKNIMNNKVMQNCRRVENVFIGINFTFISQLQHFSDFHTETRRFPAGA